MAETCGSARDYVEAASVTATRDGGEGPAAGWRLEVKDRSGALLGSPARVPVDGDLPGGAEPAAWARLRELDVSAGSFASIGQDQAVAAAHAKHG